MTDFDDEYDALDAGEAVRMRPLQSKLWHAAQAMRHPLSYGQRASGLCPQGCGEAETYCPGCTSLQCLNCSPCECGEAYGRLGP